MRGSRQLSPGPKNFPNPLGQPLLQKEAHFSIGIQSERIIQKSKAGDTGQSAVYNNLVNLGNSGKFGAMTRGDTGGVLFSQQIVGTDQN